MLKRSLTAIALLIAVSFLTSPTFGHGTRRRKARAATVHSSAINSTMVSTVKAKKPDHFMGGSDDGQSIRRKQTGRRRHNHN